MHLGRRGSVSWGMGRSNNCSVRTEAGQVLTGPAEDALECFGKLQAEDVTFSAVFGFVLVEVSGFHAKA